MSVNYHKKTSTSSLWPWALLVILLLWDFPQKEGSSCGEGIQCHLFKVRQCSGCPAEVFSLLQLQIFVLLLAWFWVDQKLRVKDKQKSQLFRIIKSYVHVLKGMARTNRGKKNNPYWRKICVYCKTAKDENGCVKNVCEEFVHKHLYKYTNIKIKPA